MAFSDGMQAGAHTVTTAEANASSASITLNMVNPQYYHVHLVSSAGVLVALTGYTVTLTNGTETSGVWSSATLTVAGSLTAGQILYWMAA